MERLSTWKFILLFMGLAEIFTALMNSALSLLWWGSVSFTLLAIGAIDALVVSLIISVIGIYLIRRATALQMANKEYVEEIKAREEVEMKLRDALATIRTLQGILPICSHCKKIRDDDGYWEQVETYISRHSDAEFSHCVCPECAKKIYPDYYGEICGEAGK